MKLVMAGFGYGADLSAVVCGASKIFWRRPWESRLRLFFSERSDGHPEKLTAVLEGEVGLPGLDTDWLCAVVFPFPSSPRSLNASVVCVMIAEALTETRSCCCASTGFVMRFTLEGIGVSFANACYSRSSLERDLRQTSLSRSRHRMDDCVVGARTGCFTIL